MHLVEAACGAVLLILSLTWPRFVAARRSRLERAGADLAEFDRRQAGNAAKLIPGLALVLGISLVVWGLTGG